MGISAHELRQMFDGNLEIGYAVCGSRQITLFPSITYLVWRVKVSPYFNSKTGISAIGCAQDVFSGIATWSKPEMVLHNGVFAESNFIVISYGSQRRRLGGRLSVNGQIYLRPAEEMFTNILRNALDQPQPRSFGLGDRPADDYRTQVLHALGRELTALAHIGRDVAPQPRAA